MMAENQFDQFIEALKEDEALQSRILSARDLEAAVIIEPRMPQLFLSMGNVLQAMGLFEEAIAAYAKAVEVEPSYADAFINWGTSLQELGRHQEAIDILKRALTLRSDYAGAQWNMANSMLCLSLNADSWRHYEKRHVDISMPGYIDKLLTRFEHLAPARPQHSPHAAPPRHFGLDAQNPVEHNNLPVLPPDRIKRIQQIIGTIMYYAHAIDITTLVALSSIVSEQGLATKQMEKQVHHLLDYRHTHKDATIRYVASDMTLNIHSDTSYLSEACARS